MDSDKRTSNFSQYKMVKDCEDLITCVICTDIFSDPRDLECHHTFCMECIQVYQRRGNPKKRSDCPVCKRNTVLPLDQLDRLIKNEFAVKLIDLLNEFKVNPGPGEVETRTQEPKWNQLPEPEINPTERIIEALQNLYEVQGEVTGMNVGDQMQTMAAMAGMNLNLPESSDNDNPQLFAHHMVTGLTNQLLGGGLNLGNLLEAQTRMMSAIFGSDSPSTTPRDDSPSLPIVIETDDDDEETGELRNTPSGASREVEWPDLGAKEAVHDNVKCDSCQADPIKGSRFKCGLCDDINLCENCFKQDLSPPEHLSWHYYILIQRPVNIPPGKLLSSLEIRRMSLAIQPNDTFHRSVQCDCCQLKTSVRGIHGLRFKCGICDDFDLCQNCITDSSENHDSTHTFIVCRYYSNYGRHAAIQNRKIYE